MIGCSKLLCGTATVSELIKFVGNRQQLPSHMLQFSTDYRPVVVWNTTNRCNLACRHCYIDAQDREYAGELSTAEGKRFIDDLARLSVPVLMFSGGEPLVRSDVLGLGKYAHERGLRPVLSTNGTLITPQAARAIKQAGFAYVGVSLDGDAATHDLFRGQPGAFGAALTGIRNCVSAGIKTGVRFTVNKLNWHTLPQILKLVEQEQISRFCMYHLVYAGRAKALAELDTTPDQKRQTIALLVDTALDFAQRGVATEILTTDNHADGIYILQYCERYFPERVPEVKELLRRHGGCSAGGKMANVDPQGNVHACQFWGHQHLGNIREQPFSAIWRQSNQLIRQLRDKANIVTGRCGQCRYKDLCGGCRIRAEAVAGSIWAADPACYLADGEVLK